MRPGSVAHKTSSIDFIGFTSWRFDNDFLSSERIHAISYFKEVIKQATEAITTWTLKIWKIWKQEMTTLQVEMEDISNKIYEETDWVALWKYVFIRPNLKDTSFSK